MGEGNDKVEGGGGCGLGGEGRILPCRRAAVVELFL